MADKTPPADSADETPAPKPRRPRAPIIDLTGGSSPSSNGLGKAEAEAEAQVAQEG